MASQPSEIIALLDGVHHGSFNGDEVSRLEVRAAARRLLARVESPYERAWGFCFEHPVVFAALQTFIDLGLWKAWTVGGGGEKSVDDLVKLCARRLFRLLVAFNVVEETGPDSYKPTPFSSSIGDESTKSPDYYEAFTGHMEAWTAWKTPWTKIYDPKKLLEGAKLGDDSPPLVVDVGGNTGLDISHVLKALPDLRPGALVLQDLPEIIAKAQVDDKVTAMVHDFFQPQPIKGSRAYFMHAVLHDWPDAQATQLLENTRDAMVKDYSKLFVYDIVMPPTGASISQSTMDVQMMSLLSAAERTKSAWETLLTGAGFKIVNFWPDPQKYEMLIEAEVA
ncbi:unnamed protein product [Parascedosporium putredinis]|uniref:O-methyltransferase C-terminal domain-containing protein n=1 Tax=Parascedosporium putredinis TaxID=1442378 RepID=A0A9P1H4F6_9PEZI|nr:unnamed protein product [Parascedosporium putredinis]CAI7996707.1 unnamed protein product [Parascedosporium putredinis]